MTYASFGFIAIVAIARNQPIRGTVWNLAPLLCNGTIDGGNPEVFGVALR